MKNLIIVIGAGHCNNEYVSWLLNHSPDTGPRQRYLYTHYDSEWGTHYRAQDDWMLEQYGDDFLDDYKQFRNPKHPHFLNRDAFEKWIPQLLDVHTHDAMSVYINVLNVSDSIDYIRNKAVEWGIDVHFVTSYWNFELCTVRHYYIMMEFDPTSTDEDHPDCAIDVDFMSASLIDRHNLQIEMAEYQHKLDLVAYQSETDTTHWFEKVGLRLPHNMQRIIEHYRFLNKPTTDTLKELNTLTWTGIQERYWKCEEWSDWQRKIGNPSYFKKTVKPGLVDK
tara:strand:- start:3460 stop:4296 length:837 start_codon:yes stop_codon:yes gene_type:complete